MFEAHFPLSVVVPEDSPMGVVFERDFNNVDFDPVVIVQPASKSGTVSVPSSLMVNPGLYAISHRWPSGSAKHPA